MKIITLESFSEKIHSSIKSRRVPLDVSFELTYRCNNNCVHCFCNLPYNNSKALKEELTTEEIKNILDELSEMGCLWLLFTGGEPLLRDDFEDIYLYAKKRGFIITLFTNGTLINSKIINLFSHYPPFSVEITLYGATEETFEKVTRKKGSYKNCLSGIQRLLNAGLHLKLKAMAITLNMHEIDEMHNIAHKFKCDFRFDTAIQKRIDSNSFSTPEQYRLSPDETVAIDIKFPYRKEAFKDICTKFDISQRDNTRLYQCNAGRFSMHINPYGIAMGCMMMINDGFSIREHGLKWIWENEILSVINSKKDFALPCDECTLINICGQCPGWSMVEFNDVRTVTPFLCETAKKRNKEMKLLDAY
ncbi:MAG: radical SAM protein [Candidatus Woesearchaeota archaeon]